MELEDIAPMLAKQRTEKFRSKLGKTGHQGTGKQATSKLSRMKTWENR